MPAGLRGCHRKRPNAQKKLCTASVLHLHAEDGGAFYVLVSNVKASYISCLRDMAVEIELSRT